MDRERVVCKNWQSSMTRPAGRAITTERLLHRELCNLERGATERFRATELSQLSRNTVARDERATHARNRCEQVTRKAPAGVSVVWNTIAAVRQPLREHSASPGFCGASDFTEARGAIGREQGELSRRSKPICVGKVRDAPRRSRHSLHAPYSHQRHAHDACASAPRISQPIVLVPPQ